MNLKNQQNIFFCTFLSLINNFHITIMKTNDEQVSDYDLWYYVRKIQMFKIWKHNNIIVLDKTNNSETLSTEGAVLMRVILDFLFLHTLIQTISSRLCESISVSFSTIFQVQNTLHFEFIEYMVEYLPYFKLLLPLLCSFLIFGSNTAIFLVTIFEI